MPDKRQHRGPHPDDHKLFAPDAYPTLRAALADYSLLLTKGYAERSALKLVGDHFSLRQRQRLALMRSACSDQARQLRRQKQVHPTALADATLLLDGYNVLTTVEAALAGGVILLARDGCYRDLASIHGTYRQVNETCPAADLIGQFLTTRNIARAHWYLDSPVSNSGRLKTLLLQIAAQAGWNWRVELVYSPDAVLANATDVIATADSVILDKCTRWCNLARAVLEATAPPANLLDFTQDPPEAQP